MDGREETLPPESSPEPLSPLGLEQQQHQLQQKSKSSTIQDSHKQSSQKGRSDGHGHHPPDRQQQPDLSNQQHLQQPLKQQHPKKKTKRETQNNPHIPLRFVNNTGHVVENSPDERGKTVRIVPGERNYNEIVKGNKKNDESDRGVELRERIDILRDRRNRRETNTLVFASSMTRDIVKQSFKEDCNGSVHFHEFKGKPDIR